jgi:uncharacterized protein YkwD
VSAAASPGAVAGAIGNFGIPRSKSSPAVPSLHDTLVEILFMTSGISHSRAGSWIADFPGMPGQRQRLYVTTVICMVGLCSTLVRSEAPGARPAVAASIAAEVVDLTNVERTGRGRGRLRTNPRLMRAAQVHAEQMARAGQLAHDLPKAAYPRTEDRLAAARYRWQMYGENVAQGQANAADALRSWMNSPGHRKNILNPAYTELGTGYAVDRAGRPYFVQVFGRPSS